MHKVDKKGFYVLNILQNLILLPNVLSIKLMRMRLFDLAQNFELIITDKIFASAFKLYLFYY